MNREYYLKKTAPTAIGTVTILGNQINKTVTIIHFKPKTQKYDFIH